MPLYGVTKPQSIIPTLYPSLYFVMHEIHKHSQQTMPRKQNILNAGKCVVCVRTYPKLISNNPEFDFVNNVLSAGLKSIYRWNICHRHIGRCYVFHNKQGWLQSLMSWSTFLCLSVFPNNFYQIHIGWRDLTKYLPMLSGKDKWTECWISMWPCCH